MCFAAKRFGIASGISCQPTRSSSRPFEMKESYSFKQIIAACDREKGGVDPAPIATTVRPRTPLQLSQTKIKSG